jgi:hypothetical protein
VHAPPSSTAADSAAQAAAPDARAAWRDVRITVARAEFDRIPADASAWASVLVEVGGGPYVDLGRIMLSGTARPAA